MHCAPLCHSVHPFIFNRYSYTFDVLVQSIGNCIHSIQSTLTLSNKQTNKGKNPVNVNALKLHSLSVVQLHCNKTVRIFTFLHSHFEFPRTLKVVLSVSFFLCKHFSSVLTLQQNERKTTHTYIWFKRVTFTIIAFKFASFTVYVCIFWRCEFSRLKEKVI